MYLLRCRNCSASYVGETGRAFRTRIDDHISADIYKNPIKSAFFKNLLNHGHHKKILIYCEDRFRRRLALEKLNNPHSIHLVNRDILEGNLIIKVYSLSLFLMKTLMFYSDKLQSIFSHISLLLRSSTGSVA